MASPSAASAWRSAATRLVLLAFGCAIGILVGEAALRSFESARPNRTIDDPRLGLRLAPHAAGTDARGYRNPVAVETTDVLALGDSQTWGVNARLVETWPSRLEALSGLRVYNMSGGGFGTVQYVSLLEESLSLRPSFVVIGLYLGNDIYDAYKAAYSLAAWESLRLPNRPELENNTVGPRADREWNSEKAFQQGYGASDPSAWGLWLRGHSAIGRLLERSGLWTGSDAWFEIGRAWAIAHPESGSYYDDGVVRTVFTVGYRAVAVDLDEPRIREGLRITSDLLARARLAARSGGAELLLVVIPTKERVFARPLSRRAVLSPTHSRLVRDEDACRESLIELGNRLGIPTLDLLETLAGAVERGQQIYPTNIESHPSPAGYDLMARAIAERLSGARARSVVAR